MSRNKDRLGVPPQEDETLELETESIPPVFPGQPQDEVPPGFNWTNPTYFVDLPSKGRFYPKGHPLHLEEQIEIRYMTAKEEDILSSQALLRKGIAVDRVLESVLVNKAIKLDDLLLGDKNALTVGTRITGYGKEYSVQVTCPKCSADSEYEFDLELVSLNNFEQQVEEAGCSFTPRNTIVVKLPLTGAEVEIKLLTGADEKSLLAETERKRKKNLPLTTLTDQLRSYIVAVNGVESRFAVAQFVNGMPARDSKFLRNLYSKIAPNIDLTQEFDCPKCGNKADMEVPLGVNFFWPE